MNNRFLDCLTFLGLSVLRAVDVFWAVVAIITGGSVPGSNSAYAAQEPSHPVAAHQQKTAPNPEI
jgi:hypothetical protein